MLHTLFTAKPRETTTATQVSGISSSTLKQITDPQIDKDNQSTGRVV